MKPKSTLRSFLLLAGSSLLAVSSASATEYWWDSNNNTGGFGTTNGAWADPTVGTATAGWSTSSLGTNVTNGVNVTTTNADDLNFSTATLGYAGGSRTITVSSGMVASSIQLGAAQGANRLTLSGGSITIGGSGTRTGILINAGVSGNGGALDITGTVALNGPQNWTNNGTGVLILSNGTTSVLTGTANLGIDGTGRVSITGVAGGTGYSGNITVSGGGELEARTNITASNGVFGTGNINVTSGTVGLYYGNSLTRGIGTGAGQIQFSGGVSGISGNGATGSTFTLSGMTWGTTAFDPSEFILQNATSNTNGGGTLAGNIDLGGSTRTIRSNQGGGLATGGTGTFSGNISNGGITKVGVGTHVFSGTNSYAGGTTINEGVLRFNTRASMPASGTISVVTGATLGVIVASSGTTWGGGTGVAGIAGLTSTANGGGGYGGQTGAVVNFAGNSSLELNVTANTVESNAVTNGGATNLTIIKTGANMLTLSGANTYTGGTRVFAGTLAFANGSLGPSGTINASGGTLTWLPGNTQDISSSLAMTAGTTTTFNTNGNDVTFANAIGSSTNATLAKAGLGTLTLQGQNTYTGGTTVSAGTLKLESGASNITQSLGALSNNSSEGTVVSNKSGAGNITTSFNGTYSRSAGAAGNIVTTGGTNGVDNIVNLNGAAGFVDKGLYFGGSEFAARNATNGYVRALAYGTDANAVAVDAITASKHVKLTSTPGSQAAITLLSLNLQGSGFSWATTSGALTVPGIIKSGGGTASTISGGTLMADATHTELVIRTDTTADSLTISSDITGGTTGTNTNAALTKTGAGTLSLSGTNTYAGLTYVTGGLLKLDSANAIPGGIANTGGTNRIIMNGGVIGLTAASGNFARGLTSTGTTGMTVNNTGGGFAAFGGDRTVNFGGASASFNWNASNGGGWGSSGGALMILSHADADGKVIIANGIKLADGVSNVTQTVRVDNGSAAIDAQFSGVVENGVSSSNNGLIKTGAGTLSMTNANIYTGATSVSNGTLLVNGSLASGSAVTVGASGTLGGSGTINGTLSVTAGGTIQIGASGSTLSLANSTAPTYNSSGGTYTTLKLNASAATLDKVLASATTGNSVANVNLVIDTTGLTGNVTGTIIYQAGGAITGPFNSVTFSANPGGYSATLDYSTSGQIKLALTSSGGSAYDTWKATNAPTGTPDDDYDGDGVSNAVEFVLGGTSATKDLDKLPVAAIAGTDMTFTFKRDQDSIDPKTALFIETSTDLATWNTAPSPYTVPDGATGAVNPGVTVVKDSPVVGTDTVTLTVPRAPDTKKFARLKAVVIP